MSNESGTPKALKSPDTWVSVPSGYDKFVFSDKAIDGRPFSLQDETD